MKNKLLNFIDLLIFFFNQGYSLQETLDFCSLLNYEKEVKEIKNYLNQGFSLDEIFIMLPFPTLFKEYYSFFKNEFTLETALKKSIEICKKRDEYKNIFLKKLAYPIILLIFLFVFSIFTVFYLLPQVEILFNDFDIQKIIYYSMSICIITCNSCFFNTNYYNKYYFNDIYLSKHCKTKIQSDRFFD